MEQNKFLLPASIIIAAVIISGAFVWRAESPQGRPLKGPQRAALVSSLVLPPEGITLPVRWGDLGAKMISVGVIDKEKFEELYASRGGLDDETRNLLYGQSSGNLVITPQNAGSLLNLFWALGLGNKNPILETGPMNDPRYGGAGGFAATGGWTLATTDAMDHYSRHKFFSLTEEQQKLVEEVSKNIYRPCCNNPTHFPDCNHGMAMLGLLELMASQGVSEEEMYKSALQVNAYWFPETYLTIAKYLELKGVAWEEADPKEILGVNYSSASGFRRILSEVAPVEKKSGASCGV